MVFGYFIGNVDLDNIIQVMGDISEIEIKTVVSLSFSVMLGKCLMVRYLHHQKDLHQKSLGIPQQSKRQRDWLCVLAA